MKFRSLLRLGLIASLVSNLHAKEVDYAGRALEVTEYLREHFHNQKSELYAASLGSPKPDFVWGSGVMFSALAGAAKHDKKWEIPMRKYFQALEGYWDDKVKIPGYEPAQTAGNGKDKYYDDNAWMVITFAEAFELTKESRYLKRSIETQEFVMSGWDDKIGGGIWWHEGHKGGCKNTCANAPAAVGALMIARNNPKLAPQMIADAKRIVEWTNKTLQASNGLFGDNINVETGKINHAQLSYNAGLMLRANLMLHQQTKNEAYLTEAKRIGKAAASLVNSTTGAYRDPVKWSHLMTEADLELYQETGEAYLLERSKKNADHHYQAFKTDTPRDLITLSSIARELWLLSEVVQK